MNLLSHLTGTARATMLRRRRAGGQSIISQWRFAHAFISDMHVRYRTVTVRAHCRGACAAGTRRN